MRSARAGSSGPGSYAPNVRSTSSRVANHPSWIAARSSASFTAQSATSPPAPASRTVQRRPVDHYASNNTARPGRARPTPRHAGAAGRRHADHAPARRRLYQPQHPTGLPRRAGAPGRLAGDRPAHRRPARRLPRRALRGGPRARHRRRRRRRPVSGQARRPAGPRRGSDRPRVGRLPAHGRRAGPGPGRPAARGRARRDSRHRRPSPHGRPVASNPPPRRTAGADSTP